MVNLSNFFFINENNLDFLKQNIEVLEKTIKIKIYVELFHICSDKKYKQMKDHIENHFLNLKNSEDLNEFFYFVENLKLKEEEDEYEYDNLMEKINERYLINESDFYSNDKNIKIELLSILQKNDILKEDNNSYYDNSIQILDKIFNVFESKEMKTVQLNSFVKNNEENILERLNLFKLLKNKNINSNEYYNTLKKLNEEINNTLEELLYIKDALEVYHKEFNKKEINKINNVIEQIKNGKVNLYNSIKIEINELLQYKNKAKKVNEVKDLKIFKLFYSKSEGGNPDERFENAYEKLKNMKNMKLNGQNNLINTIQEEIKNSDDIEIQKEITEIMKLNNNSEQMYEEELNIILNSKNYEKDINSIFYFMNNFQKNYGKEDLKEFLSLKYKNLSEQGPEELKTNLKELKEKGIYDYIKENNNNKSYLKIF